MSIDWEEVIRRKEYVMHKPTGIAAQAIKFIPPGEFHSGGDPDQPTIKEPVIQLADGNAFIADPSTDLLVIDIMEFQNYRSFQKALSEIIIAGSSQLQKSTRTPDKAADILLCALRAQLIALSP